MTTGRGIHDDIRGDIRGDEETSEASEGSKPSNEDVETGKATPDVDKSAGEPTA